MEKNNEHQKRILEQFTKQAIPFAQLSGHYSSMEMLLAMSEVCQNDNVLDVACGPGLVAIEFAKKSNHVTGIDITEKMIEEAHKKQKNEKITNVTWEIGDVTSLPYSDNSFSIVVTRYSFHHFMEPEIVLNEMIRVCKPNGKIMVIDVTVPKEKNEKFNKMEKLRDPSHTKALTPEEFQVLFSNPKLIDQKQSSYKVEMELEAQLKASFPNPGDDDKLRRIFKEDIEIDNMGIQTRMINTEIHFSYPISIFIATKK